MTTQPRKGQESGFTLVELLIVVAIIGIIAAIAVVNFRGALDRSRQTKTMAAMRNMASAINAYQSDHSVLPPDGSTASQLATLLRGGVYNTVEARDGWLNDLVYSTNASQYTLRSYGSDGVNGPGDITRGTRDRFDYDIVLTDGSFTNSPER